ADGVLVLRVGSSEAKFRRPVVYQEIDGVKKQILGSYVLNPKSKIENRSTEAHDRSPKSLSVGFQVAAYDHARPLVIDPVLVYSTYLGGSGNEGPFEGSITVDVSGSAYITGFTPSSDFPLAAPYQSTYGGGTNDAFIVKLSPDGSQLIYSTYLGGSGDDQAVGITVDAAGYAYVAGSTASTDFPTVNPLQAAHGGGSEDAFITKLDPTGSTLIYSTYLGGSANDGGRGIGLDTGGNVYVSGATTSPDFPLANPIQSVCGGFPACSEDFFVAKLNAQGDQLLYSTYLGGSNLEQNYGSLAVDNLGNAYVAGGTQSSDFPTVNPFQSGYGGGPRDAFVAKLKTDGSALVYSTYLGGSRAEQAFSVAVDAVGNAYVSGATGSSADFPLKNPLQPAHGGGNQDGFVAKLTASGALVYSTYLGGSGEENSRGIAVDAAGQARVTGVTSSTDFPTVNAFQPVYGGGINDGYIVALNAAGSALLYSTYFGGSGHDRSRFIALDSLGNAYVTGWTDSADFPTMNPLQPTLNGPGDIFIAKIGAPVLQVTIDIKPGSFPNSINLGSKGTTPVAILSSASFDAATVDPTTVTLAGAPVASRGKGRSMASTEDVNGDALPDLVVHVSTEALHLSKADTLAVLEGQTFAGMPIRGADSVRIVP
ncbi:MAG: SBBP repeat-containing protein, partial [Deltaproteobacteria bacterium]|nr:SBBP repeat-containing protein [Deltaproteobacteria bacterium]